VGLVDLARDTMRTDRFEIVSHRPIEVIVTQARAAGASGFLSNFAAWGAQVRGRADAHRIVMVRRSIVNNSWRPYLFARPEATGDGTRIHVEVRPPLPTLILMAVTVPLALVICVAAVLGGNAGGLLALLFPAWALLLTAFGGWMARNDRAMLRSVIEDIAGAPGTAFGQP
jgi:hypothetical protein